MLVIRLFRAGKKHQPFFKIVATDKRRPPKGGRFVEELGFLNPLTKEKKVKGERVKYWISKGAKPSDTVYNLLVEEKILEGKKIAVHKKSKKKEEAAPEKAEEVKDKASKEEVKPAESPKEEKPEAPEKEAPAEEKKPEEKKKEEEPSSQKPEEEEKK
jgi:small subunit ribosomal protein S16